MSVSPYATTEPAEPYLMQIGDIGITRSWVVTPSGTAPLRGSEWSIANHTAYISAIPVWAIVLAIVFFPIGLLFLMAKEQRVTGWIEVTVRSAPIAHVVSIPAGSAAASAVYPQVAYACQLAAG